VRRKAGSRIIHIVKSITNDDAPRLLTKRPHEIEKNIIPTWREIRRNRNHERAKEHDRYSVVRGPQHNIILPMGRPVLATAHHRLKSISSVDYCRIA